MTFIYYLLIGTLFTLMVDLAADYLKTDKRFNNIERVVVILIWPISLFVFVREFWKVKNGKL